MLIGCHTIWDLVYFRIHFNSYTACLNRKLASTMQQKIIQSSVEWNEQSVTLFQMQKNNKRTNSKHCTAKKSWSLAAIEISLHCSQLTQTDGDWRDAVTSRWRHIIIIISSSSSRINSNSTLQCLLLIAEAQQLYATRLSCQNYWQHEAWSTHLKNSQKNAVCIQIISPPFHQ